MTSPTTKSAAVRPGYKQTEVGVIPMDWETQTILGLSHQIIDYRGRTPRKLGMDWGNGEIPALSAGNVKMGFIDFSEECYYGSEALYRRWMTRGEVKKDDIIFTTEAPLGNVALVPDNRKYILSQRTVLLQIDPKKSASRFLFQCMLSDQFQRILADYSSGSTAKGIQRKKFEQLQLPVPSLPEQLTIATVLSDVDALLGALARFISKKRDLKQAAMQQLLTGKKRLPGFTGEWEEMRLGDVVDTDPDNLSSDTSPDYSFNYIALEDVDRGCLRSYSEQKFASAPSRARQKLRPNDVLVSTVRPNLQSHLLFNREADRWVCSTGFCVVRCHEGVTHPVYVFFHFFAAYLNKQIDALLTGSNYPAINSSDVRALQIPFPSYPEQAAIAEVLTDMDAEIEALEAKLVKARHIKQGMMQELLTGRIRLV